MSKCVRKQIHIISNYTFGQKEQWFLHLMQIKCTKFGIMRYEYFSAERHAPSLFRKIYDLITVSAQFVFYRRISLVASLCHWAWKKKECNICSYLQILHLCLLFSGYSIWLSYMLHCLGPWWQCGVYLEGKGKRSARQRKGNCSQFSPDPDPDHRGQCSTQVNSLTNSTKIKTDSKTLFKWFQ